VTLIKLFEDQIEICGPRQVNLRDLLKQNSYEAFNSDVLHFIAQLGEVILADSGQQWCVVLILMKRIDA
jgi:hypothetical protein